MKVQKLIVILSIMLPGLHICFGQNAKNMIVGKWKGDCLADSFSMVFQIDISRSKNSYSATFSSPDQRALDIPLRKLNYDSIKKEISFSLVGDANAWDFNATVENDKMTGVIRKGEQKAPFSLKKQPDLPLPYTKVDTTFKNDTVTLAGTLYLPKTNTKAAGIIFLHGSGPEPRFAAAYYGDYFARSGIAVLTYDKRGVNKSTGNWRTASFIDLAKDALAGIKLLETLPQINNKKIGVYGHSQGGSICPLLLTMYPRLAFGISAASAGVSMEESDWYEVQNRFKRYVSGQDYERAMEVMRGYLQFASRGTGYEDLMKTAKKYDTASWFNRYIGKIDTTEFFFSYYRKIGTYNPVDHWKSVKQPVLILKGENDLTSPGYPSFDNIEKALRQAGNKKYKIVLFPNTTHEMHLMGKPTDFWFRATPNYCETIIRWLKTNVISK